MKKVFPEVDKKISSLDSKTIEATLKLAQPLINDNRWQFFEQVIQHRTNYLTVVIEDVEQERNAGALIRSCDSFGVQTLHVIEKNYRQKVADVISKGATKWVNVQNYSDGPNPTKNCIETLKQKGYRVAALTPHTNDVELHQYKINQPTALVFGTEQTGVSETVFELADDFIRIPMVGFAESFNISVSAALSMYEFTNQLKDSTIDWKLSQEEKNKALLEWCFRNIHKPVQALDHILSLVKSSAK